MNQGYNDFVCMQEILQRAHIDCLVDMEPRRIRIRNQDLEHIYFFNDREELLSIQTKCFERTSYAIRNGR